MKTRILLLALLAHIGLTSGLAQQLPGPPEENGLQPKSETLYVNGDDWDNNYFPLNNDRSESLGVAIAGNGSVIIGWEDDGSGLDDLEAVWTLYNSSGVQLTADTEIRSLDPQFAGQTVTLRFLSYFRSDQGPVPGYTSWGPKIKANLFGEGVGMGATAFALGVEVPELEDINIEEGGGPGDFPAVQLTTNDGQPIGIQTGVTAAYAETPGDIRIADWGYLSTGNIVIVGESRQETDLLDLYGGTAPGQHAILRIVDPTGAEVKAETLVSEMPVANEIWHGVGVTEDGFGVRFAQGGRTIVRLFDNSGNPTSTNLDVGTLTGHEIAAGGGRGDSAGFHGNGRDAYVIVNQGNDPAGGGNKVWVTVLNADGTVRYSRSVADDLALASSGGAPDAAIDPEGRVVVVFSDPIGSSDGLNALVMGRLFDATGEPLGGTYYVSEKEDPFTVSQPSESPRVSWRGGLLAVVWESRNDFNSFNKTVALRLFSTFKPGSIESVGLTRIVPDTPLLVPENAAGTPLDALGNWEPYASVLGTSTFLIEGNTFADDGTDANQRYVVALQPANGDPMRLGEGFYADDGTPFTGQVNLSRQNGNPGRVAGDKRRGAVNFMVGGEASPHGLPEFLSDNRWDLGFDRGFTGRYGTVQIYALDPGDLTQTPLTLALDAINGRLTSGFTDGQVGRFGGDLACLDNGNFLAVVEDRSQVRVPENAAVAVIMAPDGTIVTESFLVENRDTWSNVAAYQGGFCVRVHENLHFFNNLGELQGTINQATSGESFDTGRGDGTRIAAHINSPYVYLGGKVSTANVVKVAIWDARDRSFVTVAEVSEAGFAGDFDRVNLAVDALNRVTVSWVSQPPGYELQQVAARVLASG